MTQTLSFHGRAGEGVRAPARAPNKGSPEAGDEYTFRAPRHGDLVSCPYCGDDNLTRCDWCGDEGFIHADDFFEDDQ